MSTFYASYPISGGSGGGVTSLNSLAGALTIAGSSGIAVTALGSTITVSGSGFANTHLTNLVAPVTPNQDVLILDGTVGPTYTFLTAVSTAYIGDVYTDGITNYTVQANVSLGTTLTANGALDPLYQAYSLTKVSGNPLSTNTIVYTNYSVPVAPGLGFATEPTSGIFRRGTNDWGLALNGNQFFEAKTVTAGSYTGDVVAFGPPGSISGDPDTTFAVKSNFANPAKFFFSNSNTSSTETGALIELGVGAAATNSVLLENWTNNTITHPYLTDCGALYANSFMNALVLGSENATGYVAFTAGGRLAGNEVMRMTTTAVSTSNQLPLLTGDGTTSAPGFAFSAEPYTGWMRTGTYNPTLITNAHVAFDAKYVGTNQINFGFGTTASPSGSNPLLAQTNYSGAAYFQYNNANQGSTSATVFQILNGAANTSVALNLENRAYQSSGYLAGACVLTAGASCAPLFYIGNEWASGGNVSIGVGGRTATNVKLQVTSSAIQPQNGAKFDANSTQILNVVDPTTAQMAATKNYVDTAVVTGYQYVNRGTNQAFPTAGTWGDGAGSITLGVGTWDISSVFVILSSGGVNTATYIEWGIGAVSGNNQTGLILGDNYASQFPPSPTQPWITNSIPSYRVTLATPTTYYLKVKANNDNSNLFYVYRLSAVQHA